MEGIEVEKDRILIVEDDRAIRELLEMNLMVTGYSVCMCGDGNETAALLEKGEEFALALVDIMLPGKNGFALLPLFRERGIPVIFLTARDDVNSKVRGLKGGAEDYIVKPFEVLELLVRVEKVLERTGRLEKLLRAGDVEIHLGSRTVLRGGEEIRLKPLEYELLVLLARNKNVTFTRKPGGACAPPGFFVTL